MRWNHQGYQEKNYREGDQRIRRRFLLLPKTLNHQTRWLEEARVLQRYQLEVGTYGELCLDWVDVDWWAE